MKTDDEDLRADLERACPHHHHDHAANTIVIAALAVAMVMLAGVLFAYPLAWLFAPCGFLDRVMTTPELPARCVVIDARPRQ